MDVFIPLMNSFNKNEAAIVSLASYTFLGIAFSQINLRWFLIQ